MAPENQNPMNRLLDGSIFDPVAIHAHWLLRVVLAGIFLFHGVSKFTGPEGLAGMLGVGNGLITALGAVELAIGVLVLVGGFGFDWATRIAGLLIIPVMIGAVVLMHWPQWSFAPTPERPMGGMEFQATLVVLGLYLVLRGNGIMGRTTSDDASS